VLVLAVALVVLVLRMPALVMPVSRALVSVALAFTVAPPLAAEWRLASELLPPVPLPAERTVLISADMLPIHLASGT
jgi:hypothetical protein